MKTRVFFFISCLLLTAVGCWAQSKTVKGNGNVITKEIPISDYDEISYVGKMNIEYKQSDGAPSLTVKVDENILSNVEIKVKGRTLVIQPKYEKKSFGRNSSLSLDPTVFEIKTNSRSLKDIDAVGAGEFKVLSPLSGDKLEVSIAGSSTVHFTKLLEVRKAEFSVAGSGDLIAAKLKADNLDCSVAGSGSIKIEGEVERSDLSVAGGGDIHTFGCKQRKAECSVAGGGDIEVYAVEQLDASIAGGGDIRYEGDPKLSQSVIGGGSIRKK